jgi:hypothetical protein
VTWRFALSKPELMDEAPAAAPRPAPHGATAFVGAAVYVAALVVAVVAFPRVAAIGYLLVAVRGVFFVGGEGQLGLSALLRPRR